MIKRIKEKISRINTIPMNKMEPLQIGIIVNAPQGYKFYNRNIVLRTASVDNFEVMNISNPGQNSCWVNTDCDLPVRLLDKDEMVILEISNSEEIMK